MENTQVDPEKQQQARAYGRIKRRLAIVSMALSGLYAVAWLVFGWSVDLQTRLTELTRLPWLLVALFALIFGGIYSILTLPLDFYSDYTLPHRFGMSNQTLSSWITDQLKGLLISAPLGLALLELVYALLRWQPNTWWLWVAVVMLIFNVLIANLAPVLLYPLFNKFVPLGEEHAELVARLMQLAERAETRVQGVFQFDLSRRTRAANAAVTGLGRTRRIIIGDTLINEFSIDEIETVMAHELGHQVNKDIPVGIAVESVLMLLGLFLAYYGLRLGVSLFGLSNPADPAALPLLILVIGIYSLVTMPLVNAYSRWREGRADEFALRLTHNGTAYASALTRLANQNLSEIDPEPWVEWLFYSHPALGKRIRMANEFLPPRESGQTPTTG